MQREGPLARLLPPPAGSARCAAHASGGTPKHCAERNAAPGAPISVQLSAAFRSRPGRLATVAVLLGGIAPLLREPGAAGEERPARPAIVAPAAAAALPAPAAVLPAPAAVLPAPGVAATG